MTLAPIVATALAGVGAPIWHLYVASLDVMAEPGLKRYSVAAESMRDRHAFWNQIGSLTFVIDDPSNVLTETQLAVGMEVRLTETRAGVTYAWFTGYITRIHWAPAFGQQGKAIAITAHDVNIILDWVVTASELVFTTPQTFSAILQACLANTLGLPELRAGALESGATNQTSDSDVGICGYFGAAVANSLTIPAGTSIRRCADLALSAIVTLAASLYVDPYRGLRALPLRPKTDPPFPLLTSAYNETPGTLTLPGTAPQASASSERSFDGGSGVRSVAVIHPTLGRAALSDGSGLVGPTVAVASADWPGEGADDLAAEARNYLVRNPGSVLRGKVTLEGIRAAAWNIRPQTLTVRGLAITLDELNLAAAAFVALTADATFYAGGVDYDFAIAYGALPASGAQRVRSLTRDIY